MFTPKSSLIYAFLIFVLTITRVHSDVVDDVQVMFDQGQFEAALPYIEKAIKADKNNEKLQLQKGYALIQLESYDEGIKWYKKLIRRFKDNPEPMNNLGVIYRFQGNYEESIRTFKSTIKKFPAFEVAHENLGDTYIQLAETAYQQGVNSSSNNSVLKAKQELSQSFNIDANQILANANSNAAIEQSTQAGEVIASNNELFEALQSWANGWSSKNPDQYFVHYSRDFTPVDSGDIESWMATMNTFINDSEYINIKLSNLDIDLVSPDFAIAIFDQSFESNLVSDTRKKQLKFRKYPEGWLIVEELTLSN